MKLTLDQLEVGKWYKHDNWGEDSYAKFLNSDNKLFNYSEFIFNNKWIGDAGAGRGWLFEETSIDEIQKYLPLDHPDLLIIKPILIENYDYLIKLLNNLGIK